MNVAVESPSNSQKLQRLSSIRPTKSLAMSLDYFSMADQGDVEPVSTPQGDVGFFLYLGCTALFLHVHMIMAKLVNWNEH